MHMSQEQKKEWLPKLQVRYERRNREGKSRMLDELCEDYGYERKYAIKLLGDSLPVASGPGHPGPERRHGLIEPDCQRDVAGLRAAVWQASGTHSGAVVALL